MLRLALLGLISGFPWVLIGSALSLWLKEEGLSRTTIGWAGLIFTVYAFNFLWAPLVDRIQIPFLSKRLGHRRAWIVTLQVIILASLCVWSVSDPSANLKGVILVGLIIAIASATQDITIDALRIEQVGRRDLCGAREAERRAGPHREREPEEHGDDPENRSHLSSRLR